MFVNNGRLIRPAQYGIGGYGNGLVFREILKCNDHEYEENTISFIKIEDVIHNGSKKYTGIHTYNFNHEYEVVDFKIGTVANPLYFIARAANKLIRVVLNIFR